MFTGSGISAESGLRTFRDSGGLWEEYDIYEVATPDAWQRNPQLVQRFYNERRRQVLDAKPNAAHLALADLETAYEVTIITQNVDDLHERAGSTHVVHLHGEIRKSRSSRFPDLVYEVDGWEIPPGAVCERGSPLRPHIVWFGEAVPLMQQAMEIVSTASVLIIIGTSLEVYPAAGLIHYAPRDSKKYVIDPEARDIVGLEHLTIIRDKAGLAAPELVRQLLTKNS